MFCVICDLSVTPIVGGCGRCGVPMDGISSLCGRCVRDAWPLRSSWARWELGGAVQRAVHRFKYGERPDLARVLGAAFDPRGGEWDRIVPVPLHPRRAMRRGYNQAALLATQIGDRLQLPVGYRDLQRFRRTRPQALLRTVTERAENIRGAFRMRRGVQAAGARILLVDDVVTTGATMGACAKVLRKAGAAHVDGWSVARGL